METLLCNAKDDRGMMPLHLAGKNGHVAAIKALPALDADVTTKDGYGKTVCNRAAQEGPRSGFFSKMRHK